MPHWFPCLVELTNRFGMAVALYFFEEGKMYFSDTYGLGDQQVLTGFFKSDTDLRHAREILTDFGYPKEAAEIIEVNTCSRLVTKLAKYLFASFKDRALLGISLGVAVVFAGFAAVTSLYLKLGFYEIAALFAIWFVLISLSIVVCSLIGALVAALIGPVIAAEFQPPAVPEERNVLISVAVRTSSDAEDIAREWEEIGGKVV